MFEILDISVAKPDRMQTVRDASIELALDSKDTRMYERFFGLETFPRDPDQTLNELIEEAVVQLIERQGFSIEDLALVIYCHTVPSIAPIREEVVLPIDPLRTQTNEVFSVTMNHCATAVSTLELIEAILPEDGLTLVLMGDKGFHPVLREIKNTTIMGESAVAILIGPEPGAFRHIGTHTERLGKYAVMSGLLGAVEEQGFAKEYVSFVARCVSRCLDKHDVDIADIKLVLPHNVNLPSWDQIATASGMQPQQVYLKNVPLFGHMFNADPFFNLVDAVRDEALAPGDLILLVSVGLGATASCALMQVGNAQNETRAQANAQIEKETSCV